MRREAYVKRSRYSFYLWGFQLNSVLVVATVTLLVLPSLVNAAPTWMSIGKYAAYSGYWTTYQNGVVAEREILDINWTIVGLSSQYVKVNTSSTIQGVPFFSPSTEGDRIIDRLTNTSDPSSGIYCYTLYWIPTAVTLDSVVTIGCIVGALNSAFRVEGSHSQSLGSKTDQVWDLYSYNSTSNQSNHNWRQSYDSNTGILVGMHEYSTSCGSWSACDINLNATKTNMNLASAQVFTAIPALLTVALFVGSAVRMYRRKLSVRL